MDDAWEDGPALTAVLEPLDIYANGLETTLAPRTWPPCSTVVGFGLLLCRAPPHALRQKLV
eukprot:403351-Pelagomonas_calceolata.AAC.4